MEKFTFRSGILLATCIVLPLLAGMIGSFFTIPAIPTWYATLNKPFFSPPNWVFAPVWTTLYVLMGIALFLVVRHGISDPQTRRGAVFFGAQLLVNALWSFLFFGLQSPILGLAGILILLSLVTANILTFYRVSRPAAWLLVPYLCWGGFATLVNAAILVMN